MEAQMLTQPRSTALRSTSPQASFSRKFLALLGLAALWAGLVLLAGCDIFNPDGDEKEDDGNTLKPYPVLSQPAQVLESLEMAYQRRDSVKVKELYDSTYTGRSVDLTDLSTTIDVTYFDEVAHVAALARAPGLTSYLELGSGNTWERLKSDDPSHPEWTIIQITGATYNVEIFDGPNSWGARGEAGTFLEFAFEPTPDDASPTDTLWKIIRWRETGKSAPTP
jgi:hypothetical protein